MWVLLVLLFNGDTVQLGPYFSPAQCAAAGQSVNMPEAVGFECVDTSQVVIVEPQHWHPHRPRR